MGIKGNYIHESQPWIFGLCCVTLAVNFCLLIWDIIWNYYVRLLNKIGKSSPACCHSFNTIQYMHIYWTCMYIEHARCQEEWCIGLYNTSSMTKKFPEVPGKSRDLRDVQPYTGCFFLLVPPQKVLRMTKSLPKKWEWSYVTAWCEV